jgi:nitroreductase
MDLHDAIATRRTVQRYTGEPVPADVLDRALAAAHMAPCHKLTWPWRFTVVGPEGKEQLVRTAIVMKAAKKGCTPEQMEGPVRNRLGSAGTLVLVSQVLDADPHRREEDYAATACAVQNLMLSLHAQGYGSKWSTGGFSTTPDTYAMAGIDPATERIVGCILAGTPAARPNVPPRPEVAELVRRTP